MSKTTLLDGEAKIAEPAVNGLVHVSPTLSVHSVVVPPAVDVRPAETATTVTHKPTEEKPVAPKVEIVRTFDNLTWDGSTLRKPYRNHPIRYGGLCEKMSTDSVKLAVKGSHQAGSNHGYTRKEDGSYYGS